MENQIKAFRIISTLEAISFLLLLGLAMPLRAFWDMPQLISPLGRAHGALFVLYVIGAIYMWKKLKWDLKTLAIVLICSAIPFGPFYAEKKYL